MIDSTSRIGKRVFDVFFSILFLVLLVPGMALIALAIRINMGAPVIFRQSRSGHNGKLFHIFKFRTMRAACSAQHQPLPDAERLTSLGRFLRALSLDELPELWNVLNGEMSLVGPRPLLPEYLSRYSAFQSRRLEVKPGITGWAQVNGRNALTWQQKFDLDVWYVENVSLWLDLKICWRTVNAVITGYGITQPGHATMPEFMGSRESIQQ